MANLRFNNKVVELDNSKEIVLEIENYKGCTLQGFKIGFNHNKTIELKLFDESSNYQKFSDLDISMSKIDDTVYIYSDKYCVADIDEDYLFDTDNSLVRLQEVEIDWDNLFKYKYSKELKYDEKTIGMLEFSEYYDYWADAVLKINNNFFDNINKELLEDMLRNYTKVKTDEEVLSGCKNYYMFDKEFNVYKIFYGWDVQCDEIFNDVEKKMSLDEVIDEYGEYLNTMKAKNDIINILKEYDLEKLNLSIDKIKAIKITTYIEDSEVAKDIILIDNDSVEHLVECDLYPKLESVFIDACIELDARTCTELMQGMELSM